MAEDDLLKKWLNNELSDAEMVAFSKREDYAINKNIIEKALHFKASEFSKVKDFESFKQTYQNRSQVRSIQWFKPLLRIASVVVIALAVYFTWFMNDGLIEKQTLYAETKTIELPDLSSVTLNADSKIFYNEESWQDARKLNLVGEAYFKVAKGTTFDVITDNGTVTVVGTEFNVKSRDKYFEVICYEGIVRVVSDTITRQLKAGNTYRILNNSFSEAKSTDIAPQWLDQRSRFKAVPLGEVISELERQYNVKVSVKTTDSERLFTGGFSHDNLENALSAITQPMNLKFEISSSNQVLIHGNKD
ncbi:MAG: FecR domain-containing protein [Winogradskyella sp.]|uniref:FecR family protein n=1 Tax=Winogradskyella sp. TaxID=1883156 RepID=UPI0025ED74E5|nr:FecR domain-containing protein [Winogradskyella sp.]NRB84356.1 FecR domain-containing protein [Winogradskyella sp.]